MELIRSIIEVKLLVPEGGGERDEKGDSEGKWWDNSANKGCSFRSSFGSGGPHNPQRMSHPLTSLTMQVSDSLSCLPLLLMMGHFHFLSCLTLQHHLLCLFFSKVSLFLSLCMSSSMVWFVRNRTGYLWTKVFCLCQLNGLVRLG